MTDEMVAAIICERYGWTWQEYTAQPWKFLHTVIAMVKAEGEARK